MSPYDVAYPGGVNSHVSHLGSEFTKLGHDITFIAPSSKPADSVGLEKFVRLGRGVPIPNAGSIARISLSLWLAPKIKGILGKEKFDVVHIHEPLSPHYLLKMHCSNSLTIGTFHAYRGRSGLHWFGSRILPRALERFAGRIAVSSSAKEFISRYYPGDYKIIPNGIDIEHFSRPVEPIPELCDGKLNILFVGRLEKRKGLSHLLSAYSVLKMQHTNIRLIVVGPGNLSKEIYGILGARALEDVVFTGAVSYEDLPRYFSAAHIFCSPATGRESFGIVLLEAMAAGKPIVASKIEGYSSVMSDGIEGLFAPPKDEDALIEALGRLLNDSVLRKTLGSNGQKKARGYSWVNVSREILDYYEELASGNVKGDSQ